MVVLVLVLVLVLAAGAADAGGWWLVLVAAHFTCMADSGE